MPSELEKHCNHCDEDWPADLEFFYSDSRGKYGLTCYCKACYAELIRPPASRRKTPLPPQARPSDSIAHLLHSPSYDQQHCRNPHTQEQAATLG